MGLELNVSPLFCLLPARKLCNYSILLQYIPKKAKMLEKGTKVMCSLYTIGYEGRNIDDFIKLIINNNIKVLIDVRELAISRRPGFAKTKLKTILEVNGIEYYHMPALGSQRDVRHALRKDHDYSKFFQAYRCYASSVLDNVMQAMDIAENKRACLLCYEQNPSICHRSILAEMMQKFSNNKIDRVVNIL